MLMTQKQTQQRKKKCFTVICFLVYFFVYVWFVFVPAESKRARTKIFYKPYTIFLHLFYIKILHLAVINNLVLKF